MSNMKISPDQLANAVLKCLEDYTSEMALDTKDAVMEIGKEGAQMLKANSPVRTKSGGKPGTYKRGWKFEVVSESTDQIEAVLHNPKNPGLPHLLEFGHALRQGGRASGRVHIAPVEQYVSEKLQSEIEKIAGK